MFIVGKIFIQLILVASPLFCWLLWWIPSHNIMGYHLTFEGMLCTDFYRAIRNSDVKLDFSTATSTTESKIRFLHSTSSSVDGFLNIFKIWNLITKLHEYKFENLVQKYLLISINIDGTVNLVTWLHSNKTNLCQRNNHLLQNLFFTGAGCDNWKNAFVNVVSDERKACRQLWIYS